MATQKQTKNNTDDLLDQLDDISQKLDEAETKKEPVITDAAKQKDEKKKHILRNAILCVVGACIGLCIHPVVATLTNTGEQKQPEISEEQTAILMDTWSKQTYTICGSTYPLNTTLADFQKNGWIIDMSEETPASEAEPNTEVTVHLVNGSYKINSMTVKNMTEVKQPIAQCNVVDVDIYDSATKKECTAPFGIQEGMKPQEVKTLFSNSSLPYAIDRDTYGDSYSSHIHGRDANNNYMAYTISYDTFKNNDSTFVYFSTYTSGESFYCHF
jgi:hypothetical protein